MNGPLSLRAGGTTRLFWWVLALVLLTLLLLLGGQLWISYRDQVKTAEISTRNIASIFDVRLEATLRRTEADLLAIAVNLPADALNHNAVARYAAEINSDLDGRVVSLEEMSGFRIHGAEGELLYSSSNTYMGRTGIADQAYFRILRDSPEAGLVFSEVVTRPSTGRQILVLARSLRDESGRFKGVVQGMVNLEYYRAQFKSLDLGADGIVALRRSDNHALVVRVPELPGMVNRPLVPDHPVVGRMASGAKSVVLHYSVPDEGGPALFGSR